MTRGYLRLLGGLRDRASMIGAKSCRHSRARNRRRGRRGGRERTGRSCRGSIGHGYPRLVREAQLPLLGRSAEGVTHRHSGGLLFGLSLRRPKAGPAARLPYRPGAPLYHATAGVRLARSSVGASPMVSGAMVAIGTNAAAGTPVKSQVMPLRIGTTTAQE
jgi:hypothetical protein